MVCPDVTALLGHIRRLASPSEGQPSDRHFLRRYLESRDERAFAELVRRHGPMVLGVCRGVLVDAHSAEDAFQATFLVLARRASAIRRHESLPSFLHGVALRVAHKARAGAARRRALERGAAQRPRVATMDDLTGRELRAVLHEELARLPEQYRAPLVLCYLEGLTQDEAAQRLGWPATTLKGRLARGRDLLRRRLTRRGLAPALLFAVLLSQGFASTALPASVIADTARAALAFASGSLSSPAATLADSALRIWTTSKMKLIVAVVAVLVSVGLGAGMLVRRADPALEPPAVADKPALAAESVVKERLDAHGDPLPPGAVARLGTIRFRHGTTPWFLSASPDGQLLASTGIDGRVRLWDAVSGRAAGQLDGHQPDFIWAVFSPHGRRLATSDSRAVRIWDVAGRRVACELKDVGGTSALAFSPDGKTLATATPGHAIRLWDAATGRLLHDPGAKGRVRRLYSAAFSANGKHVLTATYQDGGGNGKRKKAVFDLWEAAAGVEPIRLGEADAPTDLLGGALRYPHQLAVSADGKTCAAVTGWLAHAVSVYDTATAKEIKQLTVVRGHFRAVSFAPDGKTLATANASGYLQLWDRATWKERFPSIKAHGREVRGLAFLPGGEELASLGDDGVIRVWDSATGKEVKPGGAPQTSLRAVAVSPDGKRVFTAGDEQVIRKWDLTTGTELQRLEGDINGNRALALSPDGKLLVSTGQDYFVRLWDTAADDELRHWRGGQYVKAAAFAPSGKLLATGWGGGDVALWDRATGKEVQRMKGHTLWVEGLAFSADGKIVASCGYDGTIRIWDAASGEQLRKIADAKPPFMAVVLSPDGHKVAAATWGEAKVRVYEVATGKELRQLGNWSGNPGFAVAFSPDGRTLAGCDAKNVVCLWELATWGKRRELRGHTAAVTALAFSADGKRLVSASADATALVWSVSPALARPETAKLTERELAGLWETMAGTDAAKAYEAMGVFLGSPRQAGAFLRERLRPLPPPDPQRLAKLLADLDNDVFATREKAGEELAKFGRTIEPALRELRVKPPSAEVRRRAEKLLSAMSSDGLAGDDLRTMRAVEVLEGLGTPEATATLETLAKETTHTLVTEEARAALSRLRKKK